MEVATIPSHFFPTSMLSSTRNPNRAINSSSSFRNSLSTNFITPFVGGSVCGDFSGHKIRPDSLNPFSPSYSSGSRGKRGVVTMVIPFSRGTVWEQPPPDLASYLYKNRIIYLGMCLVPSVTELLVAEFMYLQYDNDEKPIYLYINSTGTTRGSEKLAYDSEAFAVYDVMKYTKPPIFTLCVGNAWGEASLLLAAGSKGNRSALPSSKIMMKQPIGRFQGQASDVNIMRKEMAIIKSELVKLLAEHTGKTPEQIEEDIRRPKYMTPTEAVEYGIIDKVLYTERAQGDRGVLADLKKAELI